jgi:hypothetical protein
VSTTSLESPTESGLMPVTERAIANRQANKIVGTVIAHYQLLNSRDRGTDVYWVECYDKEGEFEGDHLVELLFDDIFYAGCPCDFYTKFWKPSTTCKHVLKAILLAKKRG